MADWPRPGPEPLDEKAQRDGQDHHPEDAQEHAAHIQKCVVLHSALRLSLSYSPKSSCLTKLRLFFTIFHYFSLEAFLLAIISVF